LTRYFNLAPSQSKWYALDVEEQIIVDWYHKLAPDPVTEERNWVIYAKSSIIHLLQHKNAPFWLRDKYKNHSKYDRRKAALLYNLDYLISNLSEILNDKASTIRKEAMSVVVESLEKGHLSSETLANIPTPLILELLATGTPFAFLIADSLKILLDEDSLPLSLLNEKVLVRNMATWFTSLKKEDKDLLQSIIKPLHPLIKALKADVPFIDYEPHFDSLLSVIKTIASSKNDKVSMVFDSLSWRNNESAIKKLNTLTANDWKAFKKWLDPVNLKETIIIEVDLAQ
jgi:hypothetical protein